MNLPVQNYYQSAPFIPQPDTSVLNPQQQAHTPQPPSYPNTIYTTAPFTFDYTQNHYSQPTLPVNTSLYPQSNRTEMKNNYNHPAAASTTRLYNIDPSLAKESAQRRELSYFHNAPIEPKNDIHTETVDEAPLIEL